MTRRALCVLGEISIVRDRPAPCSARKNFQARMNLPFNLHVARSLNDLCLWIDQTALSQIIQSRAWIIPTVQSIHILSFALVVASALMINLRLVGLFARDQSLARISARFLPFVWWPLLVLLSTGTIMIIGEPSRALKNPVFQLKVVLLIAAVIVTCVFGRMRQNPEFDAHGPRAAPRLMAAISMALWVCIIFAGRWIAYA
jgi:hypothetical protein